MKARTKLMDQARKALYCLYRKLRNISIPIDLQFKLFDTLILPILTYGYEIWGYENTKQLEKLHLQFCRNILGVRIYSNHHSKFYHIVIETFDDDQWIENFRMKREIFASLCRDLEASLAPSDHAVRDVVDVQKQVAITLHWLVSSA